ncbi:GNAT family N-acetyltransferase [Elusimicrobiota bacterium]
MRFQTKRLILRPLKLSDWKYLVEGLGDLKVARFIETPYPYKKRHAVKLITECIKEHRKKKPSKYFFGIELKVEKRFIGFTVLNFIDYFAKNTITGSVIIRKYQRKGYTTEAKVPIFDFAFNKLKLVRLYAGAYVGNKASNKMIKSLGYKYEGTAKKARRARSTKMWHDLNNYGMLKEYWVKARPKIIKKLKKYPSARVKATL